MIDPLEHRLGYQLRRASAAMMVDLADTLEPFALRVTEMSVLLAIDANPDAAQADIGRLLGIKRANMTPIIAVLLARGLIERRALDGRSQGLSITAETKSIVARLQAAIDVHEVRCASRLSDSERAELIVALGQVRLALAKIAVDEEPAQDEARIRS